MNKIWHHNNSNYKGNSRYMTQEEADSFISLCDCDEVLINNKSIKAKDYMLSKLNTYLPAEIVVTSFECGKCIGGVGLLWISNIVIKGTKDGEEFNLDIPYKFKFRIMNEDEDYMFKCIASIIEEEL